MKGSTVSIIVITVVVILLCCLCLIIGISAGGALSLFSLSEGLDSISFDIGIPTATPVVIRPTLPPLSDAPEDPNNLDNPTAEPTGVPQTGPPKDSYLVSSDTLVVLEHTIVPNNDLIDLAQRLEGKGEIPVTVAPPAAPLQVGATDTFWVQNVDSDNFYQKDATLQAVTDHAYFWIEDGVRYDEADLLKLADTFENQIYYTDRAFFGSEWTPGVDGDPHLYIIFAGDLGSGIAGYYSSADEHHPLAREYSNAHETFMLNADNLSLDEPYTYGSLAHELQHMIHWYQDRNESSWLNEGFSELAVILNGYGVGGFDYLYAKDPDIQLNTWPNDSDKTRPHYGASFLYVAYFLDRFGETATQALVRHPANGMTSIDAVLSEIEATDPLTGDTISADDVFTDWVLASYIQDDSVLDGRFTYQRYSDAPFLEETETIKSCPTDWMTRDVHQYGVDYIRITCPGEYNLRFEGSIQVGVVPADPYSGIYAYWSNKGDESDMTLTREFDFSEHSGDLTLTYWTWYDLEKDYDYIYLEASLDGEDWQIITTPSGTPEDPTGNSYGWGYTGLSGKNGVWIQEKVDLSSFAGEKVQIQFEYITDAGVNGDGFLLDDVAIPEIGYFTDFEIDSGGWDAAGFVRIQNVLPQTFSLALITFGDDIGVEYIPLGNDSAVDIPIDIGGEVEEVVFVVAGTTRFTIQKAAYQFKMLK